DVVSGLLVLLTVLGYLRWTEGGGRRWYWASVAACAAALLAKSMAVCIPVLLLVLDVYPLRRLPRDPREWRGREARAVWLEKVPFAALAAAASVMAFVAIRSTVSLKPMSEVDALSRLAIAAYAAAFYLWKAVVPIRLAPLYELPYPLALGWAPGAAGLVIAAITVILVVCRRRWPGLLAAWVIYLVALLPVSGLFQNGPQIAADRYTYLPMLGFAVVAGAGIARLAARARTGALGAALARAGGGAGLALLVALMALTWQQVQVWRDTTTLWSHAIRVSPSAIAYGNLADQRLIDGDADDAFRLAEAALRVDPRSVVAHNVLGIVTARRGDLEGALEYFRAAIARDPKFVAGHINLGTLLMEQGDIGGALEHLHLARELSPGGRGVEERMFGAMLRLGRSQPGGDAGRPPIPALDRQ
ncbi:MAG TPA: tetratricopeptide repeat protein, partial [Terriglobales bacterium]|nr:tetratricopeptide repeat protein [Terriglobales bacterium]